MLDVGFFEKAAPELARLMTQARNYASDDPEAALAKLRLFGEKLSDQLLRKAGLNVSLNQFSRLNTLQNEGLLPRQVLDVLHAIRKLGNRAVHEGGASAREAHALISLADKVCLWYSSVHLPQIVLPVVPTETDRTETEKSTAQAETVEAAEAAAPLEHEGLQVVPVFAPRRRDVETQALFTLTEAETRVLIDSQIRSAGWEVDSETLTFAAGTRPEKGRNLAIAEWPIGKRRADYALFAGTLLVGLVEAKRLAKDVVSDLLQAKSYAREITDAHGAGLGGDWDGLRAPFLFASNGRPYLRNLAEKSGIWFLDARRSTHHPRPLQQWHSPDSLLDLLRRDEELAYNRLRNEPLNYLSDSAGLGLRPYQLDAIHAVEAALETGQRSALVAMATGTGKTRTVIGLIYRLLKSDRFKRILFLVDRNVLGEQSSDAFKDATIEDLLSFTQTYDVRELKDRRPDIDTKVQIATVQSMVKRLFYSENEADVLPVDAYDCIVVDEAHRGYVLDRELDEEVLTFKNEADYLGQYRRVLDWFDAVRIALTATPAAHTVEIFGDLVYRYGYREAVIDGYLIDHEPPYQIQTQLQQLGIQFHVGDEVATYEVGSGKVETEVLDDEVKIDVTGFNTRVITENFNRVVAEALVQHLDPESLEKTLIFAANDAHADLVVRLLKEAFEAIGQPVDDDAIQKITGSIYQPQQAIRRFKNERLPNIVVTVDLLSTGVDVPEICNLVFLRRVRSRILYEQMLGRATRRCDRIGKEVFRIFDAVGLYELLKDFTEMKPVVADARQPFAVLLDELGRIETVVPDKRPQQSLQARQIEQMVAKLQRRLRFLSPEARELLTARAGCSPEDFIERIQDAPVAEAVRFVQAQRPVFDLLDQLKGSGRRQLISEHADSLLGVSRGYGQGEQPEDYLDGFRSYIENNRNRLMALNLICTRPQELTRAALRDLRFELDQAGYSEPQLRAAWKALTNEDIAADIISFIRRYAIGDMLIPHDQRIRRAIDKVRSYRAWNKIQLKWLERFEKQLLKEYVLEKGDFDKPPFSLDGGYKQLDKVFNQELEQVVELIQAELYG